MLMSPHGVDMVNDSIEQRHYGSIVSKSKAVAGDSAICSCRGLFQPQALSEAVRKLPKFRRAAQVQTSTQSDSANLSSPILVSKAYLNVQKVTKAKLETMNRVCEIVKTQLAFPCGSVVAPNSKFLAVGVDSLDRTICGYVLSIHSYKYVLLEKHEFVYTRDTLTREDAELRFFDCLLQASNLGGIE
ncbi:hypothetical protein Tco_0571196 [Tanacetum coccineum]